MGTSLTYIFFYLGDITVTDSAVEHAQDMIKALPAIKLLDETIDTVPELLYGISAQPAYGLPYFGEMVDLIISILKSAREDILSPRFVAPRKIPLAGNHPVSVIEGLRTTYQYYSYTTYLIDAITNLHSTVIGLIRNEFWNKKFYEARKRWVEMICEVEQILGILYEIDKSIDDGQSFQTLKKKWDMSPMVIYSSPHEDASDHQHSSSGDIDLGDSDFAERH